MNYKFNIHLTGNGVTENEFDKLIDFKNNDESITNKIKRMRKKAFYKNTFYYLFLFAILLAFISILIALTIWGGTGGMIAGGISLLFIGGILYRDILGVLKSFFQVLLVKSSNIKRDDLEAVCNMFYSELDSSYPDWGMMVSLLAPYTANKISFDKFIKEWKRIQFGYWDKGDYLLSHKSNIEKLEDGLNELKKNIICHLCGTEKKAFRTAFHWKFKKGSIPFSFMQCSGCNKIFCKECYEKDEITVCKRCGNYISYGPFYCYYDSMPHINISREIKRIGVPYKTLTRNNNKRTENLLNVSFYWDCNCIYDAPLKWKEYGKPKGDEPSARNKLTGKIYMDNIAIMSENKWFISQPFPGIVSKFRWS